MASKRQTVHIEVSKKFFVKFIETPRKNVQRRFGVNASQIGISRMLANSNMKLPKFRKGDIFSDKRKKR